MNDVVRCPNCGARLRVPVAASGLPQCPKCSAKAPWLVAADDADFAAASQAPVPVVVDLWAPWCGPCRMVAPALEAIARDMAGRIKVVKVNVDESPRTAAAFDARSIPTLVVLRDGAVVARQVGALPEASLRAWVHTALGQ